MKRFGFNLIEEDYDRWTVVELSENDDFSTSLTTNFTSAVLHAVIRLGIPIEEIDIAVKEMCENNHNAAHFGVRGTLIYTFNSLESKKAS